MIPAWSLGVILLGYVFGFPVPFNSTQNDTRPEEPMQSWNETDSNSTLPMYNGPLRLTIERKIPVRCVVSLCALNNLGHELNRAGTRAQAVQPETHMATARDERKSSGGR